MDAGRENWQHLLSLILKITLLALAIVTFTLGEYVWVGGILFSLFLTLVPAILARDFNVKLPIIFDTSITISIFLHVFGGYTRWYDTIPHYDHFTHFISSLTISMMGVTFLYVLAFHFRIVKLPPLGFGVFAVLFIMGMGVIWEIMEWFFDWWLGGDLQRGLNDTMWDLTYDMFAGCIVGYISYASLKRGDPVDAMELVAVGDVKRSVGYRKWQQLTDKNKSIGERLRDGFRDPIILESIIDYMVTESEHITGLEVDREDEDEETSRKKDGVRKRLRDGKRKGRRRTPNDDEG